MVDIETLGTKANSVILSIAAVQFDLQTGKTGKEFNHSIDINSCLMEGLEIMEETLDWWTLHPTAKEAWEKTIKQPLKDVLSLFRDYLGTLGVAPSQIEIWGNSNRFDLGIIENAYSKTEQKIPWDFRGERDVRTLVSFAPWIKNSHLNGAKKDNKILHDALIDCKIQIEYCTEIYKFITKQS